MKEPRPSEQQTTDESRLEILGQVFQYPKTLYGTLSVLLLGLTIMGSLYIGLVLADPEKLDRFVQWLSYDLRVQAGDEVSVERKGGYKIEFWTPSARTAPYLLEHNGEIPEKDTWEDVTDSKVAKFGNVLKDDSGVVGYRRYEVVGHGRTQLKPGWWWVMTVDEGFTLEEFARIYGEYWGNPDDVYVEVIRATGEYAQ